jgi:hypothetical protein
MATHLQVATCHQTMMLLNHTKIYILDLFLVSWTEISASIKSCFSIPWASRPERLGGHWSNMVCFHDCFASMSHHGRPGNYLITRAETVGSNMISTTEDAAPMSNRNIKFLFRILFYRLCRNGTTRSVSISTCFSTLINALYCFHSSSAFINQTGSTSAASRVHD